MLNSADTGTARNIHSRCEKQLQRKNETTNPTQMQRIPNKIETGKRQKGDPNKIQNRQQEQTRCRRQSTKVTPHTKQAEEMQQTISEVPPHTEHTNKREADPSAMPISKWSNNNEAIPLNKNTETTQKADSKVPPRAMDAEMRVTLQELNMSQHWPTIQNQNPN